MKKLFYLLYREIKNFNILMYIFPSLALVYGCGSVFNGSTQKTTIDSSPSTAEFKILDHKNYDIASGKTPATIDLKRKSAYNLKFKLPGYLEKSVAITPSVSLFMWGNILFEVPAIVLMLSASSNSNSVSGAVSNYNKASDAATYLAIGTGVAMVGVLVDYITGGGFELDPDKISINLEKAQISDSEANASATIKISSKKGYLKELKVSLKKEK